MSSSFMQYWDPCFSVKILHILASIIHILRQGDTARLEDCYENKKKLKILDLSNYWFNICTTKYEKKRLTKL
jgi:hypothetical protein